MDDYRTKVQAALDDHNPRGTDDPMYIPYWARGNYARTNNTSFTLPDGTQVVGGKITFLGQEKAREAAPLPKYRVGPERPTERLGRPSTGQGRTEGRVDTVGELMKTHKSAELRRQLCVKYGIDWSIVESAPNPGVGAMRLANALRGKMT